MSYVIHKQLIPGNDLIWVLKLDDNDTEYHYSNTDDANQKLENLQNSDTEGRKYKISYKEDDGSFSDS